MLFMFLNLETSQNTLLSFFNALPQIALLLTKDMQVKHINEKGKEWLNNFGFTIQEMEQSLSYAALLQDAGCSRKEIETIKKKISSLYESSEKEFEEEILLKRSESKLWYRINVRKYEEHVILLKENITNEKKMEEKFKEKSELLEGVLDSIKDVIAIQKPDHTIMSYNKAGREMLDIPPEDVEGKKCYQLLGNENICDNCATEKALKTKQLEEIEKYIPELDIHLNIRSNPIVNEDGEVTLIIEQLRDITERKNRERERERLLEEYETIFNNVHSSIFLLNVEEEKTIKFQRLNRLEEKLTGLTTEEVQGKTPIEALGERTGRKVEKNYRKCLEKKKKIEYEEKLSLPEGERLWKTTLAPVIIDGEVKKIVGTARDITREKKEKLKSDALFENSTSAIAMLNKKGEIVDINREFKETFGYNLAEIEGENLDDVMEWGKEGYSNREKTEEILEGKSLKGEGTRYDKGGNPKKFVFHGIPIKVESEVEGAYVMYDDITKLKKEKEKQQMLLDNIDVQVWFLQDERTYQGVNETFAKFVGIDKEKILNSDICDVRKTSKNKQKCLISNRKVFESKKQIKKEETLLNSAGEERTLLITKKPILDEFGEVEYVICTAKDISEQKKAQAELKIKEEQYRKIFETAPVGIILEDSKGNILEVNNNLCEITGYRKEELIGKNILEVLTPSRYKKEAQKNIDKILAGETLEFTGTGIKKNGEEYYVRFHETKVSLPSNEEGILSIQMDITNLKEKEKELRYLSYHDGLTGLYNRSYLEEEMRRLNTKRQLPLSLIMCDINGLKLINDSLGHEKGDELLIKTANILKEVVREEDILARYGGDEFAILLPQTDSKAAEKIVKRIKKECQKTQADELVVSLGLGTATKTSVETNIFSTLKEADDNMYQNKLMVSRSRKHEVVSGLINALGAKSDETKEHAMRMTALAHLLADKIDISIEQTNKLSLLATLHDIGKISIPERILVKPDKPTKEEWEILKKHPENGYKIASSSGEFSIIAKDIISHHERWDGSGYPRGLKGSEIPVLARIISIVDAYDVMTNERPYSPAISKKEALQEIKECAGSQFDPELAQIFIDIMS